MIVMPESNRIFAIRTRTNWRVKWKYADYRGRWSSPEEAIDRVREVMNEPFEYLIENLSTGEEIKGKIK